ncbi:hypothetical protein HK105_208849 [Polyrhizophydium stewartii]|uniref:Uncharacterized protein n=1 Tax=Polyrhizophydium stewartii TaxID=2732419 RepID=A0ABR4MWU0_9FUNG
MNTKGCPVLGRLHDPATSNIQGHVNFVAQQLTGDCAPDARSFAFFKSLEGTAKNGVFSFEIPANAIKADGEFRLCSMAALASRQPVIMPDDCIRVTVKAGNGNNNGNNNGNGKADFGSCKEPTIEFGQGFDNRKETLFRPVNRDLFNHGSAQNIAIITQFICDRICDTCKAPQATQDLCSKATAAAASKTAKTGAQANAFNAVFGINTNFAVIQPIDDQGRPVGGNGGNGNNAGNTKTKSSGKKTRTLTITVTSTADCPEPTA